jgi:protein-tyrosine phosphatase
MGGEDDAEVSLFLSYARKAGTLEIEEVPDPYYDNRFAYVYELVEKGCKALLEHIRKEHDL